jgi:hypothetical protein
MATGCQNMSTNSSGSQISSINTYRITKGYYQTSSPKNANNLASPASSTPKSPSPKSNPDSAVTSPNLSDSFNYANLNQQQSREHMHQQDLKIKTKSIENTLLPLVGQITTLVNFRDSLRLSANQR